MNVRIYALIAVRNLLQAKRRTLLLGTAVAGVTALLMLLLALSEGLNQTLMQNATSLSTGHVNIAGFYKAKPKDAWPMVMGVQKLRELAQKNTPGLKYMVDRYRGWGKMIGPGGSLFVSPSGLNIAEEPGFFGAVQLAAESEYKPGGEMSRSATCPDSRSRTAQSSSLRKPNAWRSGWEMTWSSPPQPAEARPTP
jgi:putative ABC transport system permease protein